MLSNPDEIDRVIHEPARYRIMAELYVVEEADVLFLRKKTGLTWGNISSHMSKLEAAGYIEVRKEFIEKKPRTTLKLTKEGREAFKEYHQKMKDMLDEVQP